MLWTIPKQGSGEEWESEEEVGVGAQEGQGGWMKCRREHRNSLQVGVSEEEVGAGPQAAVWRSV